MDDDLRQALSALNAKIDGRFDELDRRVETIDHKVDTVHGVARATQRDMAATRGRLDILIDSYASFRTEYLRDHPHPEEA